MGKEVEIETEFCVFDKKMETPQKASMYGDWKAFKRFFEEDKKALLEPFDLAENTAIHVATVSNNPQLLAELLEMLPPRDRWLALRKRNVHKNTILHNNISVKMADVILKYEKELPPPPPEEEIDELEEKERPLLEFANGKGETPIYKAAKDGNLKLLKHMAKQLVDIQKHFHRTADKISILHAAVLGLHFDVALWLLKVDDRLAYEEDGNGYTSLQLLSKMPSVFRSRTQMGTRQCLDLILVLTIAILVTVLPEHGYDDQNDESTKVHTRRRDLETGKDNVKQHTSVLSRINSAIWKGLAKGWDGIHHIWETKKEHKLAEQLADFLVKKDNSWQKSFIVKERTMVILPTIRYSNVAARVNENKLNKDKQYTEQPTRSYSAYTPLLLAASTGIVEIVERFIELYPQAINHVSEDEQNILHVAVKHRQREIYRIIRRYGACKWLGNRLSNKGNSILHQVARMDYYRGGNQAGVAFQLQDELRWFHRVKKILPSHLIMHCNDDNLAAQELFEAEHANMHKEAQDWIKETAQSCSAVAVLVATVVFAAAYTVPGGNDARGLPIFLGSPVFLFFTIMDVVALASSLASVVMFLSILTSPFEIQEFYKSLPRKLTLGFALLFFSLTTTMLAFSATILLTIRLEKSKWTSTLIYSSAFFPVTVFALLQFPFYMAIKGRLKDISKKLVKVLPCRLTKSSKVIKKIKYTKYS